MGDEKVNGQYLPKGIYFERMPVSFGLTELIGKSTSNWHSYLIYRDGKGHAEIIRGGINTNIKNLQEFGDLELQIEVPLSNSKDSYTKKRKMQENPQTRHAVRLNVADDEVENKWKEMKKIAQSIDREIDYKIPRNFKIHYDKKQRKFIVELGEGSQVCHSVTGTVLQEAGIPIEDLAKQANIDLRQFGGIKTNLLHDKNLSKKDPMLEFADKLIKGATKPIEIIERKIDNLKIKFSSGDSLSCNGRANELKINSNDERFTNFIAQTAKSCFKNIKIEVKKSSNLHNKTAELNDLPKMN